MSVDWSEEKPTLELVKQTVTVPEVLDMLGIEVDSNDKFTSPYRPDERTPSAHAYDDHFYDYGAGKGGDLVDLVQAYQPDLSLSQVVWKIWNKALRAGKEPGDVEKAEPRQLIDFTDQLTDACAGRDSTWDSILGVDTLTLWKSSGVCVDEPGNLLIPHRDRDGIYGVKVRGRDGSKSAWPGSQFGHRLYDPYGWDHTQGERPEQTVVLCEGESDCWAINRVAGFTSYVLALPSGAGTWRDKWLEDLAPFEHVILCFDNDKAGKTARDKITSKVGHLRAEQLMVPWAFNDAREAINAGWKPAHKYL